MKLGARFFAVACWWATVVVVPAARAQAPAAQPSVEGSGASSRAVSDPELVEFSQADYPPEAKAAGLEGDVVLGITIDKEGKVTRVEVLDPGGHGFDEAAIAAAKRFVFKPAHLGDRPVASKIAYRYHFRLDAEAPPPPAPPLFDGSVHLANGDAPLAFAKVRIFSGAEFVQELTTDAAGHFQTQALLPGAYRIEVVADGFEPFTAEETLRPGEETSVNYRVVVKSEDEGDTVVVKGARPLPSREVTRRTLSRHELDRVAGTSGDALRAIQNLPGVARPPALSGQIVVRGQADQTTPVFVDGLWFPTIYHFGGLSSVVPTEMLDEINFYPGNFSVRYGRALAGVIDAHLRETRDDGRYHGLAQVDLIDARVMLEGPIPAVKGWNFIGGFRRSHVDAWLVPLLRTKDTQISAAPRYYDYQLIADTRPTTKSYLRIGFIGYDDRFRVVQSGSVNTGTLDTANASLGVGAIYQVKISPETSAEVTMSLARSHQRFVVSNLRAETTANGLLGRGEITQRITSRATLRTGFDLLFAPYNANGRLPQDAGAGAPDVGSGITTPSSVFNHSSDFLQPALYAEMSMAPNDRALIVTGVRGDFTYETGRFDIAPRMTARYDLVKEPRKTTLKAGSGLFFQPPGLLNIVLSGDAKTLHSQRAWQNSLGVEQQFTEQLSLSVEGFFNLLDQQIESGLNDQGVLAYNNLGTGRIYGAEVMLRYSEDPHFFGWVSYTLSRSERTYQPGQPSVLFYLDQPQILTVLGSYILGRGWELGGRFRYVSGNLYTPCTGLGAGSPPGIYSSTQTGYLCLNGPENSKRLPAFHELDVRVDKRWVFGAFTLGVYLDIINVYNRVNPDFISYNFDFTQSRPQTGSLPFVPSVGIRGEF
jgi:TonB family protein